jgi:hypothetical protein
LIKQHLGKPELRQMGCAASVFVCGVNADAKVMLGCGKVIDTPVCHAKEFMRERDLKAIVVVRHDSREQINRDGCRPPESAVRAVSPP